MQCKPFSEFFEIPLRNGLTKPKKVRGDGIKMVNMGELFKYPRMKNIHMDRAPLTDKELSTSMLEAGDLLFARQSLVREGAGKCSIFIGDDEPVFFESHLIRCRLNKSDHNPLFYYYYFDSPLGQQAIDAIVEQGAGAAGIRGSDLSNLLIPEYPIEFQNSVVSILDSLDCKIELNNQINQTLEQMAQAIFKSWFVDFEPIKAKIATLEASGSEQDALLAAMQTISGKNEAALARLEAEQPERYAELQATATLFPSAMQDSELGEIPDGWEAGKLKDIARYSNGRVAVSDLTLETYVSTECMIENKKGITPASSLPSSATVPYFSEKQILVSNIRPYFKKIWFSTSSGGHSPDVLCFECIEHRGDEFLLNVLYQDAFFDYMMRTSKGAKMPRGDKKAIMEFDLTIPPNQLIIRYSQYVASFYKLAAVKKSENENLSLLRDTLLPKLLSGELSLEGIEAGEVATA